MSTKHFILFVGASASLSSELSSLEGRINNSKIVAPAMGKKFTGVNQKSVIESVKALYGFMSTDSAPLENARFSIWTYGPPAQSQLEILWDIFGRSAWIEFLPVDLMHKNGPTRLFIEERLKAVLPLMHEISLAVYGERKTSPLPLPLRNFKSDVTDELRLFWYRNLDIDQLKLIIKKLYHKLRQRQIDHQKKYKDDRDHIFSPAEDSICHGQPHPIGGEMDQFIAGRFRFGASIFKGFHYDVTSAKHSTLLSTFIDGNRSSRDMKSEHRKHINIFPNDHLLPKK